MVLCDLYLWWICMICDGSVWSKLVLEWSVMVLCDSGGSYELGSVSIVFLVELYVRIMHFYEDFQKVQIGQNVLTIKTISRGNTIVRAFSCGNLSNSFDLEVTVVISVFGVAVFESVVKRGGGVALIRCQKWGGAIFDSSLLRPWRYCCTHFHLTPFTCFFTRLFWSWCCFTKKLTLYISKLDRKYCKLQWRLLIGQANSRYCTSWGE